MKNCKNKQKNYQQKVVSTFQEKPVLYGVPVVGIVDRRIDIVRYVVVSNGLIENQITVFSE